MKPQTAQQAPPGRTPAAADAAWQPADEAAEPEAAWLDQAAALAAQALDVRAALLRLRDDDQEWLQGLHGDGESCRALLRAAQGLPAPRVEALDAASAPGAQADSCSPNPPRLGLCERETLCDAQGRELAALWIGDPEARSPSPLQREVLRGIARQALDLLQARRAAQRLSRERRRLQRRADFTAVLARSNQLIAQAADEQAMLQAICDMTVSDGGLRLAWVGRPDDEGELRYLATAGERDYLEGLRLSIRPERPEGRGAAGRAWREQRAYFLASFARSPMLEPWRERAARCGMRATATLPIRRGGGMWGVFTVMHGDEDAFDEQLQTLLTELAHNISRGLDRLDAARRERELTGLQHALLDHTLAGIVVVRGRFIVSANRRFAHMLGYDDAEQLVGRSTRMVYASQAEYLRVGNLYPGLRQHGSALAMDVRVLRRDGEELLCDVSAGLTRDDEATSVWTFQDVTERARLQQRLRHEALHDLLTDLPNRRALEQYLPQALARARRNGHVVAVGMLDLDDFKPVNDSFGHDAGDRLLQEVAQRLRSLLRECDFLARLGGDEFVVVVEELEARHLARQLSRLLRRLHAAVERPFGLGATVQASVGMTMGLAAFPGDGADGDTLLRQADAALYQVKARKQQRRRWWQLGVRQAAEPGENSAFDPYGPEAAQLLGQVGALLAEASERFAQAFYDDAGRDGQTRAILESLQPRELQVLRARHAEHLRFVLDAATPREAVLRQARRLGEIHALVGVSAEHMVRPQGLYRRLAGEALGESGLPARARFQLLRLIEERLEDDLQAQMGALAEVASAYFSALTPDALPVRALWRDAVHELIAPIGRLPGLLACHVMRPDTQGVFQREAGSGPRSAAIVEWLGRARFDASLENAGCDDSGLLVQAWHSARIQHCDSYASDPRVRLWSGMADELGVRSALAIPVPGEQGQPVFVLGLFGAWPRQFSSPGMQQFARTLQQHAARVWQSCRRASSCEPLAQAQAQVCRERLFSGGLEMFVQPVVDLVDGSCRRVEALARLRLSDGTLLAPSRFLPILGDTELDRLLRLGLDQVCQQLRTWDAQGLGMEAALNLPPSTLLDPECTRWVEQALRRHGIAPQRLTLELLENQDVDMRTQSAALHGLKALGVRLAMDDLGSGYSSLQRLSMLPFDSIKLDQGLTLELRRAPLQTLGLMRAIIQLGHDLQRQIVVEGAEDDGVLEAVLALGATRAQGYGLARPMPAAEFPRWLAGFRLGVDATRVSTWLGALAAHWVDLRMPRREVSAALQRFLARSAPPEVCTWHAQARGHGGTAELARERLTDWLVGRVRAEQAPAAARE
ncbi:MAG: EAL domain-containing protein [Betaproteobacteria bacterium]|nr:EAL domain-containing protein [Betaproteobacteria bacterium]